MHKRGDRLPRPSAEVVREHDPIRRFEEADLLVRDYLKLAQIRGERNPVTTQLKESIMNDGLLYPPISARVPGPLMNDYLGFVSKLWGSDVTFDDLDRYRADDGHYYLIIAGHSRHQAFEELMAEGRLPSDQTLPTKVAEVSSVWDIIALQRADNIHSAPPKERNAMATTEAYEWGLQNGDWSSMADFARQRVAAGENMSEGSLREMRYFSRLPGVIRTFVLSGSIPYSIGVEMGKGVSEIQRYYSLEAGYPDYEPDAMGREDKARVDQLTALALNIDCARIMQVKESGKKFTIAAGKSLVLSTVDNFKDRANRLSGNGDASVEESLFELEDPLTGMLRERRKELAAELRRLADINRGSTVSFVKSHIGQGILPDAELGAVVDSLEHRGSEAAKLRGMVEAHRNGAERLRPEIIANMGGLGLATNELAEITS